MTSLLNGSRTTGRDDLPPALSSMWRLCKLGLRHEPGMLLASFCLALLAALPDALLALWFMLLGEGVLRGSRGLVGTAAVALATVLTSTWRPAVERAAQERGAPFSRLARHLFTTATTAAPGKEVRVLGVGEGLAAGRRRAWERWYGPVSAARRGSAAWHML